MTGEKKMHTLSDIARELGVNKATVPKAISGKGKPERRDQGRDPALYPGVRLQAQRRVPVTVRGGPAEDAVELLKRYGMNLVRLRLWNDPYSEAGEPYGAGTNDLEKTATMARRLKRAGVDWLLILAAIVVWLR